MHTDSNHDWGARRELKLRSAYNYVEQVNKDTFLRLHDPQSVGIRRNFAKSVKQLSRLSKAPRGDNISDRELVSNMLFLAPNLSNEQQWKDLQHIKEVLPDENTCRHLLNTLEFRKRSGYIHGAIDALNAYDCKTDSRLACGMKESTLATEYKRKQIMSALLDLGHNTSSEKAIADRVNTQDKLLLYFSQYHNEKDKVEDVFKITREDALKTELVLIDRDVPPLVQSLLAAAPQLTRQMQRCDVTNRPKKWKGSEYAHRHECLLSPIQPLRKHKQLSDKHRHRPKWEEFDVMRSRWMSVQSQVKQMKADDKIIAPLSTKEEDFVLLEDGTVVKGTILDAEYFKRKVADLHLTKSRGSNPRA